MLKKTLIMIIGMAIIAHNPLNVYAGSAPSSFSSITAEADPHSGSANLSIPIQVPSGRGGIQPNLAITYNSSNPNGIFGVGWGMEIGSIKVLTKNGAPKYDSNTKYLLMQSGSAQELVEDPTHPGIYFPLVESAFLKIEKLAGGWQVTDTNGIKYFYGTNQAAREFDPADPNRIYKWCLEKVVDLHGNYMEFSYYRDDTNGDNLLYPDEINYGGNEIPGQTIAHFAKVKFHRTAQRADLKKSFIRGFAAVTRYLMNNIEVSVEGNIQRTYQLSYQVSNETGQNVLTAVQMLGANGGGELPAMQYVYQTLITEEGSGYEIIELNHIESTDPGDTLWNVRTGAYDRGHENYGPVPGFDTELSETVTTNTPGDWTSSSNGALSVNGHPDTAYLFWTYIWADFEDDFTVNFT
ncbi:MAG: hypothetical protein KC713_09705, partial [Candidatus Omnitrophica bacterium]|nr:hypothetical protein [Candidatus Omnitrophota bacterium]